MIQVGLSEIKFAESPEVLRTMGLGSCVGVIIYNEILKSAAMAHVMLPDSSLARSNLFMPGKYADTAIPELVRLMTDVHGFPLRSLKAKMAGGAEMFKSSKTLPLGSIGLRNSGAVRAQLQRFRIPIVAEETGKDYGRTIEFNPGSGLLMIRTIFHGAHII
ncbi:chemotaxis protein CheD [Sporolactobacillus pectinivorans]|uniref:chemotaxis protein CheD n=1 Tax=Sporolactobacillus pectinivorans TaxID=1591408 RepID=UPI000C259B1C|nr:chemotaxis protein CheD [Sporolactobacillus pectinivorans]